MSRLRITGIALMFFLTNFCMAADPTNAVPMSVKLEVSNAEEYIERPIAIAGVTPGGGGGAGAVSSAVTNPSTPGASAATSSADAPKKYFNNVESGESYIFVKAKITPNWIPVSNLSWNGSASGFERVNADTYRISRNSPFEWKTSKVTLNYSGGTCSTEVEVGVYQVEALITPAGSPVGAGAKDGGDGQNEYTYSESASATFAINYKATITPANMAKPAAEKIVFMPPEIAGSAPVWDDANPGGQANHGGDPHVVAKLVMTNMPTTNAQFGEKTIKMKDKGVFVKLPGAADELVQKIEVFFPKYARNHQVVAYRTAANWFAYWKEGNVVPAMNTTEATVEYSDPSGLYLAKYVFDTNKVILYGGIRGASSESSPVTRPEVTQWPLETFPNNPAKQAADNQYGIPITATGLYPGGRIYPAITIGASGKGIRCVAMMMRHELRHKTLLATASGARIHWTEFDFDRDKIMAWDEATLNGISTDWKIPDTYGMRYYNAEYIGYGDQELRARKAEEAVVAADYDTSKDWANPGSNSKTKYGPLLEDGP